MEMAQEKLDIVLKEPIPFGNGTTELSAKAESRIKKIAEVLNEFPQFGMKTIGYTGNVTKPMELSMGRCKKVREALNKLGVKNAMSAKGMGNKDGKPRVEMVMGDAAEVEAEAQAELDNDKAPALTKYDGTWMRTRDRNYLGHDDLDVCEIKNGILIWHYTSCTHEGHPTTPVTVNDRGELVMTLMGKVYTGTLKNEVLIWKDADKWERIPIKIAHQY